MSLIVMEKGTRDRSVTDMNFPVICELLCNKYKCYTKHIHENETNSYANLPVVNANGVQFILNVGNISLVRT